MRLKDEGDEPLVGSLLSSSEPSPPPPPPPPSPDKRRTFSKVSVAIALTLGVGVTTVALLCRSTPPIQPFHPTTNQEAEAYAYMTQSVCLSPTQSDPYNCPSEKTRPLTMGENLPYVNHDLLPSTGEAFQVSNSFPVRHSDGTARVLQTLDFTSHGRGVKPPALVSFQFDVDYDGYNANSLGLGDGESDSGSGTPGEYVSILGTADPSKGVEFFVSPGCGLEDSWGLFGKEIFPSEEGEAEAGAGGGHLFEVNIVRSSLDVRGWSCPPFYNDAYTTYSTSQNFTYASGKIMDSVKVSHWGGYDEETATSAEKEFFTKQYGLTRWEAWVKGAEPGEGLLCGGPQTGEEGWVLVDCRDWSYTLELNGTGVIYNTLRVPVHPDLIGGGNWLRDGDFGEGGDGSPWWGEFGTGVETDIAYEEDGNKILRVTTTEPGTGMEQSAIVEVGVWARLGFGGKLIGIGGASTVSLTQLDADGKTLATTILRVECDGRNFEGVIEKVESGCRSLRFRVTLDSAGSCSIDDNYLGSL